MNDRRDIKENSNPDRRNYLQLCCQDNVFLWHVACVGNDSDDAGSNMLHQKGRRSIMKFSFGFNIARNKVTWSKTSVHNLSKRRGKFKHSKNPHINPNLTKFNQDGEIANYDKLMTNQCQDYVKKYNHRQILQGHKKRCYKSVKDYYQRNGKHASRNVIISMGNHNQRNKLEISTLKSHHDPVNKANIRALRTVFEPKALVQFMKDFNGRNRYLKITDYVVHVDEGIIHAHARLVALPEPTKTKNHRPSFSFSKAIREDGNSKDGRQALKYIQKQEAPRAIKILGNQMFYPLQYARTGNATRLSGERYKHYAKVSNKAKNEDSVARSSTSKASSATSVARSASTAKSNTVSDYKSLITSCYQVGYHDGSQSGSIANSKSASNAANLAYSSVSTSWASRSQGLDDREHHINNTASATNNLKNNLINAFKDEEDQKELNSFNFHKVFRILIMWSKDMRKISKIVKRAKEKARRIIAHAKATARDFLRPNKFGEKVMQDFIWKNKDCYPNVYQQDPDELHGKRLMKSFNDTAFNYHEYDSPEAHRENQQIKARGRDNGPTWGE